MIDWFKVQYPTWNVGGWSKKKLYAVYMRVRESIKEL